MGYEAALERAWMDLAEVAEEKDYSLRFLNDTYSVDLKMRRVLSLSCNAQAKAHHSIIILHYLLRKLKGLPRLSGEWVSFRELSGGQGYYPAFKKRVMDVVMRKYSASPEALLELSERFPAKKVQVADISVVVEAFERVPVLITFWRGDEEFGPEANILFDKTISDILCTEDIVVMAESIAHSI